jgi:branched-chain amino acid transport system permease protein
MVFGIYLNTGRYLMGFEAGLKAFTAAVLGGIGNIPGAVLGGYLIGFLSAFSDQYLSSAWTRAAVFLILVLVLVFKPTGILGERPLN